MKCISNGIFNIINSILATNTQEYYEQEIRETSILLLNAILPEKHLIIQGKKEKTQEKIRLEIETEKEEILNNNAAVLLLLGEGVMARLMQLFEESSGPSMKFACLQTIDKLCYFCDPANIGKTITAQVAAHLAKENLSSLDNLFVCMGLRMAEIIFEKLVPQQWLYFSQAKREGIVEQIKQLQDQEFLKARFEREIERTWIVPENTYLIHFLSYPRLIHKRGSRISTNLGKKNLQKGRKYGKYYGCFQQTQLNYYIHLKSTQINKDFLEKITQCPALNEAESVLKKAVSFQKILLYY